MAADIFTMFSQSKHKSSDLNQTNQGESGRVKDGRNDDQGVDEALPPDPFLYDPAMRRNFVAHKFGNCTK